MTSVAVVDDHVMLAQAMASQLRARGFEVHVLDLDRPAAPQAISLGVDVVLLDLELGLEFGTGGPSGMDLIEPLCSAGLIVVALSGLANRFVVADAVIKGAAAVVSKSLGFDDLVEAIEASVSGEIVYPGAAERVGLISDFLVHERAVETQRAPFERLTPKEEEVLEAMIAGASSAEISEQQFVSISTVRSHVKSIMRKLDVKGQLKAVALANEIGWHSSTDHS